MFDFTAPFVPETVLRLATPQHLVDGIEHLERVLESWNADLRDLHLLGQVLSYSDNADRQTRWKREVRSIQQTCDRLVGLREQLLREFNTREVPDLADVS